MRVDREELLLLSRRSFVARYQTSLLRGSGGI